MIIIAFDIPTSLWKALLPDGSFLSWRRDAEGNPLPDLFSSSQRALREARGALRDNAWAIPYRVEHTGIASNIEQVLQSLPLSSGVLETSTWAYAAK